MQPVETSPRNRGRERRIDAWSTNDPMVNAQIDAALLAVRGAFPYLERDEIHSPPTGAYNGAALARQVLIHTLVNVFGLPKKRIASIGIADLNKVKLACRAVDQARERDRFARWLAAIADDASQAFARFGSFLPEFSPADRERASRAEGK